MKKCRVLFDRLKEDGKRLPVPENLKPEWMEETIKEHTEKRAKEKFHRFRRELAAAACFCLVGAGLLGVYRSGLLFPESGGQGREQMTVQETGTESEGSGEAAQPDKGAPEQQDTLQFAEKSYEEIYEILREDFRGIQSWNGAVREEEENTEDALQGNVMEENKAEASADSVQNAYGQTNVRTEEVDEGDTVKNDGRYLYQLAGRKDETGKEYQGVQIVDTRDGLRETAFVGRFEYPREFYVWEDLLVVLEDGYYTADYVSAGDAVSEEESGSSVSGDRAENSRIAVCTGEVLYASRQYTKIHVYDISDRENPGLVKTFTVDGACSTSRLSDGYFYGFTFFTPSPDGKEEDYETYIPEVDGSLIPAEKIVCPENAGGQEYLVMVSIDLKHPEELLESRAVLADSGVFYVSADSIYLASWHSVYEETGAALTYGTDTAEEEADAETLQDYTQILKFSYGDGAFLAKAEGRVPGRVSDSFSLDQKGEELRVVTTATEYIRRKVTDDTTGETLGYEYVIPEGDDGLTNGLYILNENLEITGKIEGLAAGEQIYSARFLGDTAYFVTFRQTDPLFAVDVSNPEEPRLLSELKVSGFSEYLHAYSGELLLGLGVEADEETGEQQELKLSMFDISSPAELSEKTRLRLAGENWRYVFSPALYDHKSLLIDPEQNLIGFEAQGTREGSFVQAYLLYSYEEGAFVQKLEIEIESTAGFYGSCRGTFIGERFFLLIQDGSVQEYSLETGELTGELPVK